MSNKIPSGWKKCKLGEVARIGNGSTPSRNQSKYWTNGTYPWLPTQKVNDRIITHAEEFITQAALDECPLRIVPAGAVLVAMIGQGKTRGMAAFLTIDATINQNFACIVPKDNIVDGKFLFFILDSSYKELRHLSHGSNQGSLNCQLIAGYQILLPPLAEQHKITEILSTWDEAIDLTEQLIAAKHRRKQALMQRLLTGQVRFPGFISNSTEQSSNFGLIPVDWQIVKLGAIMRPISRTVQVDPEKEYKLVGVRWYGEGAHIHDTISGSEIQMPILNHIWADDILYNKMWTTKGAFAIAKQAHHDAYATNEYPQFRAIEGKLEPRYFEYVFRLPRFQHDATALCRGTTGRARLNPQDFLRLEIPLPPFEEQRKIADLLVACDEELALHQQKLAALRRQKQGLMQQLLTGRLRVKV